MVEKMEGGSVWVTWERQTRNRSISRYLEVPLFEVILDDSNRFLRYFNSILKTVRILRNHRPRYFFAQNPSVVLGLFAILVKPFFGFKVIIDAHNAGVYGSEGKVNVIGLINKIIIKLADATIVTNRDIANYVENVGGKALVLPDPLPKLNVSCRSEDDRSQGRLKCLCITSWSSDEPFIEILEACSSFSEDIDFYFSGNYRKISRSLLDKAPPNVELLGFVKEEVFFNHLLSSDFCIDLTSRMDCMVCGAYESVSAEIPIILSDTDVQKRYFSKGAVFCDNTANGIVEAISEMKSNISSHRKQVVELKQEILAREAAERGPIILELSKL